MFKKAVLALVLTISFAGVQAAGTPEDASSSDASGAVQIPTCLPCR